MPQLSPTARALLRLAAVVTVLSTLVVVGGGTLAWRLERGAPAATIASWGDSVWWALTTMTTVGYGDHVPVTTGGRVVGGVLMVAGVGVLGAVAAVVALSFTKALSAREAEFEAELEAEAETMERRLETRLDALDARLERIERALGVRADHRD